MARPLISIVIPTRNRPNYVRYALQSMMLQSFRDFEVIVCDNHTGKDCKSIFDQYSDDRFKYVVPSNPLSMHDSWEYAVSLARGEYVGVVIDKTVLRPFALKVLVDTLTTHPADAYSWRAEAYYLTREKFGNTGSGFYVPCWSDDQPQYTDVAAETRRKLALDVPLGQEGVRYYFGKICFGVYSFDLIERIKKKYGHLFSLISPDYTSMVAALTVSNSMVDVGRTLQVSLNTGVSNGMLAARSSVYAREFHREIDPSLKYLNDFPVAGIYASFHNSIAYDYHLLQKVAGGESSSLDLTRLLPLVWSDLAAVEIWESQRERYSQFQLLQSCIARLPAEARACLSTKLMTIPPQPLPPPLFKAFGRGAKRFLHAEWHGYPYYRNVIDALIQRDINGRTKLPSSIA
jgi:glycosyltransferase involved in cell wall biosynthesis